ncbi:MAG: competence protein ComEC, partial [Solobacterium sp.]|nr:competence protein ComEC [Solobacterium sp.]
HVILKASHHGSKTGSCERFLNVMKPVLTIISCGAYSIYHHPSPETLQRLRERHIPWLTTREEGNISVLWLPGFNLLITASGKLAIIDP